MVGRCTGRPRGVLLFTWRSQHARRAAMSEWFDLLNFGTPVDRCEDATPRRHRSASPSPRGRVAWRDTQPSSSPHGVPDMRPDTPSAKGHDEMPAPDLFAQENAPIQVSPSTVRTVRARRQARRAQAHTPYAYPMYTFAPATKSAAPERRKAAPPKSPRPSTPRMARVHSEPVAISPYQPKDTQDKPDSDDSFTRLVGDDDFDAAAVEELARREGW